MDASGLVVYHGTHVGSCFPSFFFGPQVSLCFSGHGNLPSKHILSNTKTENIPDQKPDGTCPACFLLPQFSRLYILMARVPLAERGHDVLL